MKAQVVRITHSTELAPKGLYKLNEENEEDPELYFEEEFKYPAWEELVNPETWIHAHQIILKVDSIYLMFSLKNLTGRQNYSSTT